jgi:hypothetical protein
MPISVKDFDKIESSINEEESYHFLRFYQNYKDWIVYDSDSVGLEQTTALIDFFAEFHGKIPFPDTVLEKDAYWSTTPLGIFKYKMLSDGSYSLIKDYKKTSGYIVQGSYWQNGFFYFVQDDKQIVQLKLFVDQNTFHEKQYPDIISK